MLSKQILSLSSEFTDILNELERSNEHFFITGKAGTGKSTLLNIFRQTSKKRIAVLAPTGIAALNVKGQTLHSFFGFPPKMISPQELTKRRNHKMYKNVDVIIIDEISMVRADMMDNIDVFLRKNREIDMPFGGVQMIFFGDMFQLPPVIASNFEREYFKEHYESPYFFSSNIIKSIDDFHMIELHEVHRQKDLQFIRILDNIRLKQLDEDDFMTINERYLPMPEDESYFITLCSRNATAAMINSQNLKEIDRPTHIFNAKVTGQFRESIYPTDHALVLKEGAQVMFVKNDPTRRFVNGSLGIITYINGDTVKISLHDDNAKEKEIELEAADWEIIKYTQDRDQPKKISTEIVGVFTQLPIKLAWAITIHKSQGKTFDRIIVDLGRGAFEYGQTYVALSRCRTLEGIYLKQPLKVRDIMVDDRITEYYEYLSRR